MKKIFLFVILFFCVFVGHATDYKITSPDGRLVVTVSDEDRKAYYTVDYDGIPCSRAPPLDSRQIMQILPKTLRLRKSKHKIMW